MILGSGRVSPNEEKWRHDNRWEAEEVTIAAVGVGGEQNLGAVVPAGLTRRITQITVRHEGSNDTVVTLLISGGATKWTYKVPTGMSRTIPLGNGREFAAAEQSAVQTSDVTGGNTYVSASGVEA